MLFNKKYLVFGIFWLIVLFSISFVSANNYYINFNHNGTGSAFAYAQSDTFHNFDASSNFSINFWSQINFYDGVNQAYNLFRLTNNSGAYIYGELINDLGHNSSSGLPYYPNFDFSYSGDSFNLLSSNVSFEYDNFDMYTLVVYYPEVYFYLNSKLVENYTLTFSEFNAEGSNSFFGNSESNQGAFNFNYDEIRIYNSSLSESQIALLYDSARNYNNTLNFNSLIGYYPLEEGSGNISLDYSGYSNNLTLFGGYVWNSTPPNVSSYSNGPNNVFVSFNQGGSNIAAITPNSAIERFFFGKLLAQPIPVIGGNAVIGKEIPNRKIVLIFILLMALIAIILILYDRERKKKSLKKKNRYST